MDLTAEDRLAYIEGKAAFMAALEARAIALRPAAE